MKMLIQHNANSMIMAGMIAIFLTCPREALSGENKIFIGSDDGKVISLKEGEVLQLSLITNPSTGYSWGFATAPSANVIKQTDHYLVPLGTMPGSASTEFWIFDAISEGSTRIDLKYMRWWETAPTAIKTFEVTIVVSGMGIPGKATLIAPNGKTSISTPTYIWSAVSRSTWYQLWVNDGTASPKVQIWYTAAQAGCPSGTGLCSVTPSAPLSLGDCKWWIQAWNEAGYGPWSDSLQFTLATNGSQLKYDNPLRAH